jgi:hypothetical protein
MPVKLPVRQHALVKRFCGANERDHPLRSSLNKPSLYEQPTHHVSNRPSGMTMEDTFFSTTRLRTTNINTLPNHFAAGCKVLKSSNHHYWLFPRLPAEQLVDSDLCIVEVPFALLTLALVFIGTSIASRILPLAWMRSALVELKPLLS